MCSCCVCLGSRRHFLRRRSRRQRRIISQWQRHLNVLSFSEFAEPLFRSSATKLTPGPVSCRRCKPFADRKVNFFCVKVRFHRESNANFCKHRHDAHINILKLNSLMRSFSFTTQLHVVQISIKFFFFFFSALVFVCGGKKEERRSRRRSPASKLTYYGFAWAHSVCAEDLFATSLLLSIHLLSFRVLKTLIFSHRRLLKLNAMRVAVAESTVV